ncbi:MAG: Thiamine pyrophosphate-requiring protein PA2108 [uncultured Solirubrobacteraceae bacterium]|uniref:Thiamine pyrophosphate-requiring protein PA2108 n=1 Tax=uncultured Solirubrobacteraceae bacterium TaxID=1162706 RepID=A0A6J4TRT6_9ACTN|nr:MAG: Thiamine pyrophosphate-requiring protein PA2108 [uncultured Solirubrobacteraceae bacterium]
MSSPPHNVSDHLLDRLSAWGVRRLFGYSGDGINGVMGALHRAGERFEFVQVAHEELAGLMATAHAKFTGEVGVCVCTSGPGAIHLLNGLYDAKLDHQPVVAIVGQQPRMALGSDFQQEVDLLSLFKDVAHEFVQVCMVPEQAAHLVDRAMRIAKATRSPTCVIVPDDVQMLPYSEPPRAHGAVPSSSAAIRRPHVVPGDAALAQGAAVLNEGSRVAILVGAGARGALAEIETIADLLGAGVSTALNGRAVVPDDRPWMTGSIGLLGTKPSYDLMDGCDTLLVVGSSFPYSEWLPEPGSARGVQIDIDARLIGTRYPMEVNLVGDAADTLNALIPLVSRKADRGWREEIEAGVARWWRTLDELAHQPADPINPQLVFHELSARLPARCILTADSGSATNWWTRHIKMPAGTDAALSGTLASMGPAVPYALAAKFAHPDRPVIAAVGDGAMQMLGINALLDIALYAERWSDQRLIVCVLNNRDLNQVTWEQRVLAGDPKLDSSQVLPDFDHAAFARQIGLHGARIDRPEDVASAWDAALAAGRPAVLEFLTDPEVPPLPPHIRFEHAQKLAQTIVAGDPAAPHFVRHALRGKLAELLTR